MNTQKKIKENTNYVAKTKVFWGLINEHNSKNLQVQLIHIITSVLSKVHTNETSIRKILKLMSIKFV